MSSGVEVTTDDGRGKVWVRIVRKHLRAFLGETTSPLSKNVLYVMLR